MSFWNWFKPKSKHTVVLPTNDNSKLLHGLDLLRAFTTDDEPKAADYSLKDYFAHWEILLSTIDGGYQALLRFYVKNAENKEVVFRAPSVPELKKEVNAAIRSTMEQYKR